MRQLVRHGETAVSERMWEWANVFVIGAILVAGERTGAAIVSVMECADEKPFHHAHRVLTRVTWSSRTRSHVVVVVLKTVFTRAGEELTDPRKAGD
jgi:hypothetical protein